MKKFPLQLLQFTLKIFKDRHVFHLIHFIQLIIIHFLFIFLKSLLIIIFMKKFPLQLL